MKFLKLLVAVIYHRYRFISAKQYLCNLSMNRCIFDMPLNAYAEERKQILKDMEDRYIVYVDACNELKKLK